jgi:hypothetical protein
MSVSLSCRQTTHIAVDEARYPTYHFQFVELSQFVELLWSGDSSGTTG